MFVKSSTNIPTLVPKISGGTAVLVGSNSPVVGSQQIIIGGKSLAGQVNYIDEYYLYLASIKMIILQKFGVFRTSNSVVVLDLKFM